MESSGRNGDDAKQPAGDGAEPVRLPLERSPEGRFVVRSSSHPPTEQTSSIDSSGVHSRPQSGRAPKAAEPGTSEAEVDRGRLSTPAERPRKRKELMQGGAYLANVRARCDTPRALPGTRSSDRPSRATAAATEPAQQSLPASAALTAAPATGNAGEPPRAVEEVTRRIRRPSPESVSPAASEGQLPWRTLAAAGLIAALFVIAVWFLG